MACWCRRWSSEPSNAQILNQSSPFLKLLLHLLPLAVIVPLIFLGALPQLFHLVLQGRDVALPGAVLGTFTT